MNWLQKSHLRGYTHSDRTIRLILPSHLIIELLRHANIQFYLPECVEFLALTCRQKQKLVIKLFHFCWPPHFSFSLYCNNSKLKVPDQLKSHTNSISILGTILPSIPVVLKEESLALPYINVYCTAYKFLDYSKKLR